MNDKFEVFMERLLQYAFDSKIGYILTKKIGTLHAISCCS
ncbi:hypothetical protein NAB2_2482 [Lactiplantibacillus plantarum]|uniref:Uncharacterized protein n=1 Tax=Lactiplantibacillus plantarum TaxID=1590 RepID=A0AAW3RED1_LACPN|nr:hypothetical protein NAB2_2482 [Lactiplantibacillus plantarum]